MLYEMVLCNCKELSDVVPAINVSDFSNVSSHSIAYPLSPRKHLFYQETPPFESCKWGSSQEGSVSTTCICAMFTKMEMVECSEIERAAGKVGYKKKNKCCFSSHRWWWQLLAWLLWVAIFWSLDRCLRQTCLDVSSRQQYFLFGNTSRQACYDISIYQQRKWVEYRT